MLHCSVRTARVFVVLFVLVGSFALDLYVPLFCPSAVLASPLPGDSGADAFTQSHGRMPVEGQLPIRLLYAAPALPLASADCPDAFEPNNYFAQAPTLEVNTAYSAAICDPSDVDYYAFWVDAGYHLHAGIYNLPTDFDLTVFDSTYTLVGSSSNSETKEDWVDYDVGKSGWFYMNVYGKKGESSEESYGFKMQVWLPATATPTHTPTLIPPSPTRTNTPTPTTTPLCPDPYEPNDAFETAIAIEPGGLLSYICEVTDQDYFKFDVQLNDVVEVHLTDLPKDYDLYVFDAAHNEQGRSTQPGTADEHVTIDAKVAGPWRILVAAKGEFSRTQPYHLHLSVTHVGTATPTRTPTVPPCDTDDYEPNNTFDIAPYIPIGSYIHAFICPPGDVDFYRFYAAADQSIAIDLSSLPADYDLFLWSPSRVEVAHSWNSGTAIEYILYRALVSGEYRVEVRPVYGQWSGVDPYDLRVDLIQPSPTATPTRTRTSTPTLTPTATATPTCTPAPDQDLTILGIEVNQAIVPPWPYNLAPVWHKPTVLRVYVSCGSFHGVDHVTARVTVRDWGLGFQEVLYPFNPGGEIRAWSGDLSVQGWENLNATLNFEVPARYLEGRWVFEAEVNYDRRAAETDYTNNRYSEYVEFQPISKHLSIAYVPIYYDPGGDYTGAHLPTARIADRAGFIRATWPLRNDYIHYYRASMPPYVVTTEMDWDLEYWMLVIALADAYEDLSPQPDHLVGWLPNDARQTIDDALGYSVIDIVDSFNSPSRAVWVLDYDDGEGTLSHELEHSYGYWHACHQIGGRGFDTRTRTVKGASLVEVMCTGTDYDQRWADLESYLEKYDHWYSGRPPWGAAAEAVAIAPTRYVVATGIITPSTTGASTAQLYPLQWITRTQTSEVPTGGAYCLEFRSASALLQSYCFDGEAGDVHGAESVLRGFHYTLPWPAGTTLVQLKQGQTVLAQRAASAHPPTVHVDWPNGGETLNGPFTVRWTGNDLDGDALSYVVLYTPDGGTSWVPLSVQNSNTTLSVHTDYLAGGQQGRIKVRVTDGFATAEDMSDGPFTVPRKPPEISIEAPAEGAWYRPGTQFNLIGQAYDPEDGLLPDSALTWWQSTETGGIQLGTGPMISIGPLPPGDYYLSLTAVDSDGTWVGATRTIHVGERSANYIYLPVMLKRGQ